MATYTLSKEYSASVGSAQKQKVWDSGNAVVEISIGGTAESDYTTTFEYYCESATDEATLRAAFSADTDGRRYNTSTTPDSIRVTYTKADSPPGTVTQQTITGVYAISKEYSESRGTQQGIKTLDGTVIYPTTAATEKQETWEYASTSGDSAGAAYTASLGQNKATLSNTQIVFDTVSDGTENFIRLSGTDQPGLSRFSITVSV